MIIFIYVNQYLKIRHTELKTYKAIKRGKYLVTKSEQKITFTVSNDNRYVS